MNVINHALYTPNYNLLFLLIIILFILNAALHFAMQYENVWQNKKRKSDLTGKY